MRELKDEKMNIVSRKKILIGIITFGILLKLVFMVATHSWRMDNDFHFAYEAGFIGASLASGNGYSLGAIEMEHHKNKANEPTAWEAPVYPFIIAAVFKVFGIFSTTSAVVLICIQIFISGMICIVLFLIGKHLFNDFAGILAVLLFILNPSAMHFVVQKIYNTPLYILFLLLFIYYLLKIAEFPSYKASLLTGVFCGMAILTAPFIIAFLPFALIWYLLRGNGGMKIRLVSICLILLAISATISPWQIRNYITFNRFILVRSNLSRELYLGTYGQPRLSESDKKQLEMKDEGKRASIYQKSFFESVKARPKKFIRRTTDRFIRFWFSLPRIGGPYAQMTGSSRELVLQFYYLFILLSGVIGICVTGLKRSSNQLLMFSIFSLPLPFYITWFTRYRYRFPVEIILTLFAAYSFYSLWKYYSVKRRPKII